MAGPFKKSYRPQGQSAEAEAAREALPGQDKAKISGIAGDPLREAVPYHIPTATEEVLNNKNNAWVVLGRDRPSSRASGYGGRGDTQAAAIDIVVGRGGPDVVEYDGDDKTIWVNPNFQKDAARIYISQKTDIDANFGLVAGRIGSSIGVNQDEFDLVDDPQSPSPTIWTPTPRSGIALKADGIRLIARDGIKLVTRTDAFNAQGGTVQGIQGVDILAGNDDKHLQPMVKGDNLQEALERLTHHLSELNGIVNTLLTHQSDLNKALADHFHFSPFYGQATTISPPASAAAKKTAIDHLSQTKKSLAMNKTNLETFAKTYLSGIGDKYINSRYNNVN
jgi:hypothetical protein